MFHISFDHIRSIGLPWLSTSINWWFRSTSIQIICWMLNPKALDIGVGSFFETSQTVRPGVFCLSLTFQRRVPALLEFAVFRRLLQVCRKKMIGNHFWRTFWYFVDSRESAIYLHKQVANAEITRYRKVEKSDLHAQEMDRYSMSLAVCLLCLTLQQNMLCTNTYSMHVTPWSIDHPEPIQGSLVNAGV